jgi:P27 family predicted phage terminase small subunit
MATGRRDNRGAQRKKQPAADPRHPRGTPKPPDFLKGLALTEWQRVVPVLDKIGKLTEADRSILVAYCIAWAQYDQMQQQVAGLDSVMVVSTRGTPCMHPVLQGRDKAFAQMLECSKRLGLSPYDRERMKPPVEESERDAEQDVLAYARTLHEPAGDDRRAWDGHAEWPHGPGQSARPHCARRSI